MRVASPLVLFACSPHLSCNLSLVLYAAVNRAIDSPEFAGHVTILLFKEQRVKELGY